MDGDPPAAQHADVAAAVWALPRAAAMRRRRRTAALLLLAHLVLACAVVAWSSVLVSHLQTIRRQTQHMHQRNLDQWRRLRQDTLLQGYRDPLLMLDTRLAAGIRPRQQPSGAQRSDASTPAASDATNHAAVDAEAARAAGASASAAVLAAAEAVAAGAEEEPAGITKQCVLWSFETADTSNVDPMPAESDGPGALPPAQILLSPPVEHRIGQRLALVVPFGAWQVGRLLALLRSEWPARPPCQAHAPYAPFVDLVLYFEHDLLDTPFTSVDELESAVRSSPAVERCFAGVHFLSARLTETQASVPSLAAARMFFKLFAPPSALAQTFDAILYLGTATTPCRALWLDRIYEDAAFGPEFWIKGSIVRDKTYGIGGLDWGAYLHGQASLYALRDPRWHLYVLQASMRFWDNPHAHGMAFDVALDRVRADRTAVDWIEFTETAHLFVFWPLVQHWRSTPVDVADVCRRYPGTYLVAGDWLADAASARPATGSSGGGG